MAQLFGAAPANDLPPVPNYNVCPTDTIAAVLAEEGGPRRMVSMRWGFLPHWYDAPNAGPLLINARAETVATKPAFREACRTRRCLVPATGFYEWTKTPEGARLPWYIHMADGAPLVMAGIWQDWQRGETRWRTCAIVTTAAEGEMQRIHHRMPVILAPEDQALWLGEEGPGAAKLMRAAPEGSLAFHRVDTAVNSNRAEGPGLIEPVET